MLLPDIGFGNRIAIVPSRLMCCCCVFLQPSISNVEDEGIVDDIKRLEEAICEVVCSLTCSFLLFFFNNITLANYDFLSLLIYLGHFSCFTCKGQN